MAKTKIEYYMSTPVKQHYLPQVYLKHFMINPIEGSKIVYCIDYSNKYSHSIRETGFKSKVFWVSDYYTDQRLDDAYAIERILSSDFESTYDSVIDNISLETSLPAKTVNDIIGWLWISKTRSPYYRKRAFDFLKNFEKDYPSTLNEVEQKLFDSMKEQYDKTSQELHTSLFYNPDQIELYKNNYVPGLLNMNWKILKSTTNTPFITNDNPGFSFNKYPPLTNESNISPVINVHSSSTNYFVLSPKYCIQISSVMDGAKIFVEDTTVDIPFEETSNNLIKVVNAGTFHTKEKLLISNSKKALKRFGSFK